MNKFGKTDRTGKNHAKAHSMSSKSEYPLRRKKIDPIMANCTNFESSFFRAKVQDSKRLQAKKLINFHRNFNRNFCVIFKAEDHGPHKMLV